MPSVLITGAGQGFGRALFDEYRQRGWIVLPLVRDEDTACRLQEMGGPHCHPVVADVTDGHVENDIGRILEAHLDSLDVLINNAGSIKKLRGLEKTTCDDLEALFRTHCVGAFRCVRACIPFLSKAEKPVVVNISSRRGSVTNTVSGKFGSIYSYQIAKCAQNMLTACLDKELRDKGIRIFAVHPGRLKTDVAPPDADTEPRDAARTLADWVDRVDDGVVCGFHDLMRGELIAW